MLYRWAPEAVREGIELSQGAALSALISKYLDTVGAADQQDLEAFFGNFVPRSRVGESIKALMGVRGLNFVPGDRGPLIQVTVTPQRLDGNSVLRSKERKVES